MVGVDYCADWGWDCDVGWWWRVVGGVDEGSTSRIDGRNPIVDRHVLHGDSNLLYCWMHDDRDSLDDAVREDDAP